MVILEREESEIMKTNGEFKFPYFLVGIALGAIAALLLAPSPGGETWRFCTRSWRWLSRRAFQSKNGADVAVLNARVTWGYRFA